ncbi:MAG TPA: hypothetical protein VGK58_03720 [Lacipirellulaceae bacterium]
MRRIGGTPLCEAKGVVSFYTGFNTPFLGVPPSPWRVLLFANGRLGLARASRNNPPSRMLRSANYKRNKEQL